MSYTAYYRLLLKYHGHLRLASREELRAAQRKNADDPLSAIRLAKQKYQHKHQRKIYDSK